MTDTGNPSLRTWVLRSPKSGMLTVTLSADCVLTVVAAPPGAPERRDERRLKTYEGALGYIEQFLLERQVRGFRLLSDRRREEVDAGLPCYRLELLDRRRTIHVAGDNQHLLLMVFLQKLAQFTDRRRLAGPLKTRHQHNGRWLGIEADALVGVAHDPCQLAMDDTDQRLARA